jgi:ABC-type arginine/histidine transport system permease subunit
MSKKDTLAILLPYAFKRALSSYSNEVVLVFKSALHDCHCPSGIARMAP